MCVICAFNLLRCQLNGSECQDNLCSKDYSFIIMTRQEIEEWVDQLARKYGDLACKYSETRDDKRIVEELYELARELEKLKKEVIGLKTQALHHR